MIGKLETGFDDFTVNISILIHVLHIINFSMNIFSFIFQYLWKKAQLDSKVSIPWYHAVLSSEENEQEKHLVKMKSFYSKVPRSTLLRVYEAYKLDFELFDYDFNQVLILAGYEPLPNI